MQQATTNQLLLPKSPWAALLAILLEKRTDDNYPASDEDTLFLQQLGFLDEAQSISAIGSELCNLIYVRKDAEAAFAIMHDAFLSLPVTQALLQSLAGLDNISIEQARIALIFSGVTEELVENRLTNLLMILNESDIITYNRKGRSLRLLVSSKQIPAPPHVYVDRTRPYANDLRIREIIRECHGSILWLDKYFQKEAFEWLFREATAEKISSIRIVSTIDSTGIDKLALVDYKKLKKELANKGIALEWRVLDRSSSHDFHDRWVLDDHDLCYNVPSISSIRSGQRSELHRSPNHDEVKQIFDQYYDSGRHVL